MTTYRCLGCGECLELDDGDYSEDSHPDDHEQSEGEIEVDQCVYCERG